MKQLIYITDPMCSWCYGFSPEIAKVRKHFSDLSFRLVMGGLRPYSTKRILTMQGFLTEHWDQVHLRSGQSFNYNILQDPDFVYDTEPPARAAVVVRQLLPEREFDFFSEVQKAFYFHNLDTNRVETYLQILDKLKLEVNPEIFQELFSSDELKADTRADFEYAGSLGVRGFPTLMLHDQSKHLVVTRGYEKAEGVIEKIEDQIRIF